MSWLHDIPAERQERCRTRARRARRMGRAIGVTLAVCFTALLRVEPEFRTVVEDVALAGIAAVSETRSAARAPAADAERNLQVSTLPGRTWGNRIDLQALEAHAGSGANG